MKRLRKIVVSLLLVIACVASNNINMIFAAGNDNSKDLKKDIKIESLMVPAEAVTYANNIASPLISNGLSNVEKFCPNADIDQEWAIGTPFTIFAMDSTSSAINNTYYFPIINNNEVKLVLSVIKNGDDWNASVSSDLADQLNALYTDDNSYVLYTYDGKLYAENKNLKKVLHDDRNSFGSLDSFNKKTFQGRINEIDKKYQNYETSVSDISDVTTDLGTIAVTYTPSVTVTTDGDTTAGSLIYNSTITFVTQQDSTGTYRGMCWAACVANTYRYMKGNSTLTAAQVCDTMGIGYDAGATMAQIYQALVQYSITGYSVKSTQITFAKIESNINNAKPVIMVSTSGTNAHATLLMAYIENDPAFNKNLIAFHNPGTGTFVSSTYSSTGTTYTYGGYTWTWAGTVSYY